MRYFAPIILMVGFAYAGGRVEFYGGNTTSLMYDSTGSTTTPQISASTYGISFLYTFFSTPIPASPRIDGIVDFKYLSVDTSSAKVINFIMEGSMPLIKVRAGFNVDMATTSSIFFDGQNAILLGMSFGVPLFHFSADYAYTLPKDNTDLGDVLILKATGGFRVGLGEFAYLRTGIDFIYRYLLSDTVGENFSIMPYAGIKFTDMAIDLILGYEDEYGYYGISASGKNAPATGLGVQLRLKYYF